MSINETILTNSDIIISPENKKKVETSIKKNIEKKSYRYSAKRRNEMSKDKNEQMEH